MNIIFFNNYHNGDIHLSRKFIIDIMSKFKCDNYYYHHFNDATLLKDIVNLQHINRNDLRYLNNEQIINNVNELIINTWVGQVNAKYLHLTDKSCSLYTYYEMFKDIYIKLNIKIENIDYYLPDIDWNYINKNNIDLFISQHQQKKILISNGNVLSGQAQNFNFDIIIDRLSKDFSDIIFITTQLSSIKSDNVFFTGNIIGQNCSDLNEISYLSKFCDILIGRSSGPLCFCYIVDNLMNKNKKIISFSYNKFDSNWYDDVKCEMIWSNDFNVENIYHLIKINIEK